MNPTHSDALVFFGATGELAYKKILPSLQTMMKRGNLNVSVIGVAKAGRPLPCHSAVAVSARRSRHTSKIQDSISIAHDPNHDVSEPLGLLEEPLHGFPAWISARAVLLVAESSFLSRTNLLSRHKTCPHEGKSSNGVIMARKQKSRNAEKPNQQDTRRLSDYEKIGPTSIEGVEASDLPDKGRGDLSTNISKEAGRKLPPQTGEWETGDTGLRGDPDIADAEEHGHEKMI